jgi:cysteinyl-tRNA synthetase
MSDDFNMAGALGHVFTLVRAINAARDAGVGGQPFADAQKAFVDLTSLLGLELDAGGTAADVVPFIEALIETRASMRREKQWELADEIRDRLKALGVDLEDGPQGTEWRWSTGGS